VKLAAIDIGTNSIHMIVVDVQRDHRFEVVDAAKSMVKLGAGMFRSRRMTHRAMEAGLDTLRRYCKLAESLGVEEILAVATSAVREADNGGEFLARVFQETGLTPRVISGTEEARLIYRAVTHAIHLHDQPTLVIDIGGGSVEIVVGAGDQILLSESVRLGVQRLLDGREQADPLSSKQLHMLRGYIQGAASDALSRARSIGFRKVVGTSGTIRTLGEATHLDTGQSPWRVVNAQVIRRKALKEFAKKLLGLDADQRARLPGIAPERADAIHLGAVLLVELLDLAQADELTLCDASLREGIVLDYLDRTASHPSVISAGVDVRRRSVLELAARFSRDDPADRHVASLAAMLFDQTSGVHNMGAHEREMLEYAALLHGIGQHIGFPRNNKHAAYIVRNARLRGLTQEEIALIALVVRYYRKALPSRKHKRFRKLARRDQRVVRLLAGMLRIAVGLDRGRTQQVKRIECTLSADTLRIQVTGATDLELELYAARQRMGLLSDTLGRAIEIVSS